MKISREARRISRELFEITLVKGLPDPKRVMQVADAVATEKPRHFISILKELTRLVRLEMEKHHAVVESATAMDAASTSQVEKDLTSRFGATSTEFRVTPALIGGLRIKIGSDMWDGSVRARLLALKEQL